MSDDKKTVALYARVSTYDQTTENQMERLIQYAKIREFEVYDTYQDTASGANLHRPQLDHMMDDARRHKFDIIIATKLDRMMRSVVNMSNVLAQLQSYNISIMLLDQPIDTSTPVGRMTTTILSAVAEFERELIHDRTKDGIDRAKREGKKLGTPKKVLSDYQLEKLKKILEADPCISQRKLAQQFQGISRNTLIKLAREEGYQK